jgi:hypothetical protein
MPHQPIHALYIKVHKELEMGWDGRSHVCGANSNYDYHENFREYFDSPKPIDLFTQVI